MTLLIISIAKYNKLSACINVQIMINVVNLLLIKKGCKIVHKIT